MNDLHHLLTPAVINPAAEHAFSYGGCGALAIAIHDAMGWPIVAITDHHNVEGGQAGGGSAMHWVVEHPSGKLLDIDGLHHRGDLVEDYHGDADDGEAAAGAATREDAVMWWEEAGEKVSLEMAATFIEPLLVRVKDQGQDR